MSSVTTPGILSNTTGLLQVAFDNGIKAKATLVLVNASTLKSVRLT